MSNQTNEVFIGARALKEQINLILPTYNLLLEQIEQIRGIAENETGYKKEHNNTIGIFGERGTGKTSALYTIMEHLEKNEDTNIILPIIEPDNFGENTKIMGSIIGLLSDAVEKELEKIKKLTNSEEKNRLSDYFNNCIFKENNPLKLKRDKLIEYHLYTENEYRNLLTHNFDDTATHIKKSSYLLTPDIKFKEKLINLIDFLVKTRRELSTCNRTPLVFIFIDDIDLKTTKCKELIDSILQYANHTNVVTILSGDYEILKESITLALISDENLRESNLAPRCHIGTDYNILDRKKYIANEYLKKIIPPARRHNVVKWNIKTIPNFAFGDKTLAIKLNDLLGDNNFLGYIKKNKIVPIKYCYSIFDKTPRGLVNVYYHIHQIIQSKNKNAQGKENLFKNLKSLIDTIIISSTDLVVEQKKFFEECLLWGDSAESTFIDYKKMLQYEEAGSPLQNSTFKINKNLFNFLIICELLKQLIKGISYIGNDYEKFKNLILRTIYLDPKDKKIDDIIDSEGNLVTKSEIYIYKVVLEIAYNTNLKSALLLLEYLTSGVFGEDYGYKKIDDENKYLKDRNIFIAICNLIKQNSDSTLLKDLYLKSYDEKNSFLFKTFEFINDICSTTQEFSISEKTFKLLISKAFEKFGEFGSSPRLIKMLFINTLIVIEKKGNEKIEEKLKELDKESPYYKQCRIIKNIFNKLQQSTEITDKRKIERWRNNISKIINKLGEEIEKLLLNKDGYELAVRNNDTFIKAKDDFVNGYSGSESTKYSQLKTRVKSRETNYFYYLNDILIGDIGNNYYQIFRSVTDLSNNNRVWYGRQEAIKFLEILKQQFYLDLSLFEEMIPLIYELGIYLRTTNLEIKEDEEFEEYKKYMKTKLDSAFKEAMEEVETDLEEIGSSLEDDEKEN